MKKTWIKVKRGLLEPKHIIKLGQAWYLYFYILDNADWETGKIFEWKDKYAADELRKPLCLIREHRKLLIQEEYISATLNKRSQTITINNWTDPRKYDGVVINKAQGSDFSIPKNEKRAQGSGKGNDKGSGKGFKNPSEKNTLPYNHISHNTYHNDKMVHSLIIYFLEQTKLKEPKYSLDKKWIAPIKQMLDISGFDLTKAKKILLLTIKDCDKTNWSFSTPYQILSRYKGIAGRQKRKGAALGTEFNPEDIK